MRAIRAVGSERIASELDRTFAENAWLARTLSRESASGRLGASHSRAGVVGVAIAVILVLIAATYPLAGLILRLRRPLGTPSRALSQLRTRGFELAPIP